MKVQIPDQLKADMPQTTWGKILSATPVVMAVVATMLAGLASSEMTRAQYVRALAAQQQSKAGDQWSFFQAKRLRGAVQRNSVDLLETMSTVHPFTQEALKAGVSRAASTGDAQAQRLQFLIDSAAGQQALGYLQKGEAPRPESAPPVDPKLKAALEGLEKSVPDTEMFTLLAQLSEKDLDQAVRSARDQASAFDNLTQPINRTIEEMSTLLARSVTRSVAALPRAPDPTVAADITSVNRDFTTARLTYTSARYETEARLNQAVANILELQVRKSNIAAERHHMRSQRFFFGMLAAQLGVIVSTFAMAARKRSLLWSVAAAAGIIAIIFAIYVYLYV